MIANPPYLGEKGYKEKFREIRLGFLKDFYQSKMDIFYFFFHLGLTFVKENGTVTYITTNYFPTADGAIKLRKEFKETTCVKQLINFNEFKIFDSALGQHNLITILKKTKERLPTKLTIVNRKNQTGSSLLNNILTGSDIQTSYSYRNEIFEGENNYIRITSSNESTENTELFEKLISQSNRLDSILNINSGCDVAISKITDKHIQNFPKVNLVKGEGVFVLSEEELKQLHFNNYEESLVKVFIKNSDISQFGYKKSKEYLLYIRWEETKKTIPNIIEYLSRFKSILQDQVVRYEEPSWPWYSLHRPREQTIFENRKILVPYRSKVNSFAVCEEPIYSSRDVFFITNKPEIRISLHAINAILNSKLIYYWLINKGKRKGDTLELYYTPLSEIPISKNLTTYSEFLEKKSKQISLLKLDGKDTRDEQLELDSIVYQIYNINFSEIQIIESSI